MKPAPFRYRAAESVEEVVSLLAEFGEDATVLAGGQSLVPLMNMRLARPAVLVDINRVNELDYIHVDGDVAIGAITRQRRAERSREISESAPLLQHGLQHVGHVGIRSRGTVGGSVAHADPASELPAVLQALDGQVVVRGPQGERTVPAADLFVGAFSTSLGDAELLTGQTRSNDTE